MKLEVIRYFTVLAESSSISEAAQKLYIAQPSLTKALQLLEEELGISLFERSRSGIQLTPAGERILPEARQVVSYYDHWLELGHQNILKNIDLFVSRSFADFLLPHILIGFGRKYPDVSVNYEIALDAAEHISSRLGDPAAVLLVCNDEELERYTKIQGNPPVMLARGETRCLVSAEDPLSSKDALVPEDLKDHYLVLPGSRAEAPGMPSGGKDIAQELNRDFPKERRIFVGALSNVIRQVAENPGTFALSFYPALLRYERVQQGNLRAVPFEGHREETTLCLFYSKKAVRQHPVLAELTAEIRRAFAHFFAETGAAV